MSIFIKSVGMVFSIGVALFVLSMLIYFFNLDMKVSSKMQPLINKWYDHHQRRPMP